MPKHALRVIVGMLLLAGGIYLEHDSEMKAVSQSYLVTSLGLLSVFFGAMLLVNEALSYLGHKRNKKRNL